MATDNGGGSVARRQGLTITELAEELTGRAEDYELLYFEARAVLDEIRARLGAGEDVSDRALVAMIPMKAKVRAVGEVA